MVKKYIYQRIGEPNCAWANIKKIKKDFKWKPEVSFEEGVKHMLNDVSWKKAPLWDKRSIKKATKTWFKYLK